MGQRVSLPSGCFKSGASEKVRVQKPCGRYEEESSPCMASKVMGKHPEHLVVHCAFDKDNIVDISVIQPNEDLKPGVPYMLYPKVEATQLAGGTAVKSNIPLNMCMSMKDRQMTFRSSISPESKSKKFSLSKDDSVNSVDDSVKSV